MKRLVLPLLVLILTATVQADPLPAALESQVQKGYLTRAEAELLYRSQKPVSPVVKPAKAPKKEKAPPKAKTATAKPVPPPPVPNYIDQLPVETNFRISNVECQQDQGIITGLVKNTGNRAARMVYVDWQVLDNLGKTLRSGKALSDPEDLNMDQEGSFQDRSTSGCGAKIRAQVRKFKIVDP